MAGLPNLFNSKFEGICIKRYPTKRIDTAVSNWTELRFSSSCSPANFAAAMLFLLSLSVESPLMSNYPPIDKRHHSQNRAVALQPAATPERSIIADGPTWTSC